MKCLHAYTAPTPPGGYPAYVSINHTDARQVAVTVRSAGLGGLAAGTINLTVEQTRKMIDDLLWNLAAVEGES